MIYIVVAVLVVYLILTTNYSRQNTNIKSILWFKSVVK
jgi:hypothetical protein